MLWEWLGVTSIGLPFQGVKRALQSIFIFIHSFYFKDHLELVTVHILSTKSNIATSFSSLNCWPWALIVQCDALKCILWDILTSHFLKGKPFTQILPFYKQNKMFILGDTFSFWWQYHTAFISSPVEYVSPPQTEEPIAMQIEQIWVFVYLLSTLVGFSAWTPRQQNCILHGILPGFAEQYLGFT